MKLDVFFSPADVSAVQPSPEDIYIVIDVIRATTSLTVIFDRGAERVLIANTLEQAREAASKVPGRLLCGERNALPLPGFDYGNSPVQFSQANLTQRELVLTTTNGTRAFFSCPDESTRLAGCFYNAQAVTTYALSRARTQHSNIALVCAAEQNYFALDDAVCAGYLALELQEQNPELILHESALAAIALYSTYAPPRITTTCNSAQSVIKHGLQEDLELCMRYNASISVPRISGRDPETQLLIVQRG